MKWMNDTDPLRGEDWAQVYPDVPPCMQDGMDMAFRRIRARRVQEKKWRAMAACAACAVLALGVGAWLISGYEQAPDRVADPVIRAPEIAASEVVLTDESIVYAARADGYYHLSAGCPAADGAAVELPLITAREFGKQACAQCAGHAAYAGDASGGVEGNTEGNTEGA